MVDPSIDFRQYQTFNFLHGAGDDGGDYASLEARYLMDEISREMTSRGFSLSDNPDMTFNFSIDTEDKVRTRTVPQTRTAIGYDPFLDVYYDDWVTTHETRIDQYTEGRLDIDVIDVGERKMIWQGTTKGRLTKKDYKNAEKTLRGAVREVFTRFPVPAGS